MWWPVVLLLVLGPLIGFVSRRWLAVLIPAVAWPLFYVGLDEGWWGSGTGDGWQYVAAAFTTAGLFSTAFAVGAARAQMRRPG
jgi:hypothetical protein